MRSVFKNAQVCLDFITEHIYPAKADNLISCHGTAELMTDEKDMEASKDEEHMK